MRRFLFYTSCIVIAAVGLTACKQDPAPDFHFDYFGMEEGRFVIYDVVEVEHDDAINVHDTTRYQLKTVWGDTYIDNEGRSAREFLRYTRSDATEAWALSDLWTGVYDGIRAELVEENQRVVKLVFAPSLSKQWDANAYNTLAEQSCYYRDIHKDTSINNYSFDSTVVVEIDQFYSLIDTVRVYEMYAKDVGLIYKHSQNNQYQFGSATVTYGAELYVTYNSHGFE